MLAIHHTDTIMKEMLKRREKRERDKVIESKREATEGLNR